MLAHWRGVNRSIESLLPAVAGERAGASSDGGGNGAAAGRENGGAMGLGVETVTELLHTQGERT